MNTQTLNVIAKDQFNEEYKLRVAEINQAKNFKKEAIEKHIKSHIVNTLKKGSTNKKLCKNNSELSINNFKNVLNNSSNPLNSTREFFKTV